MNISSNLQLVPYQPGPSQDASYAPKSARADQAVGDPAVKQYIQMPAPRISRYANQPESYESVYYPSRRAKTQKIHEVGLLIDIYA